MGSIASSERAAKPPPGVSARVPAAQRPLLAEAGRRLPGVGLLAAGAAAALVAAARVPALSSVVWAVLFGAGLAFLPLPERLAAGMDTYPSWVKLGVVLSGAGVSYASIGAVGLPGAALVAAKLVGGFAVAEAWGRVFRQRRVARRLMGLGTSVCGMSAIVTAAPMIGRPEDGAGPAAAVILWGASCLLFLPAAGHMAGIAPAAFGAMAGLAVDNTAESLATGFAYGPQAGAVATALKLARNAFLGVAVAASAGGKGRRDLPGVLRQTFPWFIAGFLAVALLNTLGAMPPPVAQGLKRAGEIAFLFAFTGLGVAFRRTGRGLGREVLYGLVVEASGFVLVTALALALLR